MILLLQVLPEAGGAWLLTLGRPGAQAAVGRVDARRVDALLQQVEEELGPQCWPVLAVQGEDADLTEAEERAGRLLGAMLGEAPELARTLHRALGAAQISGQPLYLLIDARDPKARALPWECLAVHEQAVPLERGGEGLIARLAAARPPTGPTPPVPSGRRLRPLLWRADPADPAVERLAQEVRVRCAQSGLGEVTGSIPGAEGDDPLLLFLVGHGESVDQGLRLMAEGGSVAPGTVTHGLLPAVERAALVVLLVCEGGCRPPTGPDGLVDRLLLAGAAAVVSSEARLAEDAAVALLGGLVIALADGQPLLGVVGAARRAVAAGAWPWPESRWWRLTLTVGEASTLDWHLPAPPALPGWPADPELNDLLRAALAQAQARGHGWLGVEHLALALDPLRLRGPRLRDLLRRHQAELASRLDRFTAAPGPTGACSPRLEAARRRLPDRFGLDELVEALVAELPDSLAIRLGLRRPALPDLGSMEPEASDSATREESLDPPLSALPPVGFEVLGGPEDGRRLALRPGEVLGRASEGHRLAVALYENRGGVDEFLSRTHLRAEGEGRYLLLRPGDMLLGEEKIRAPSGPVVLRGGQVLGLTRATLLLALDEADTVGGRPLASPADRV